MSRILRSTQNALFLFATEKLLMIEVMVNKKGLSILNPLGSKFTNMEYTEIVIEAVGTLAINKLRTGLAALGIVIGIGSVIALISLGQATQQAVQSRIEALGSNLLTVQPGAQSTGVVRGAAGSNTTLTLDDANAIKTSG